MARLRPLAVLMLLAASAVTAAAGDSTNEKNDKKPAVVERKFDVPLDFKNRSGFNVGDPASIPSGRTENLSIEPRTPFIGLGITRPFGSTK